MTRHSKRELERAVEDLGSGQDVHLVIAYGDNETGKLYRSSGMDGEPIDLSDTDSEPLMVILCGE